MKFWFPNQEYLSQISLRIIANLFSGILSKAASKKLVILLVD